ncbi:restriction endonuclease, partial [Streptomyces goshikiensis]
MSRRAGSGLIGDWAQAQRRQQQTQVIQQRDAERRQRAYERDANRSHRQYREAEALRRTARFDAEVAALKGLLAEGCRAPAFRISDLTRPDRLEPFDPGA